jgi:ABC-type thiamin/hydroxymethylpyrimidine transport system permease subunit
MTELERPKNFPTLLTVGWWFVFLPFAALAARLLYEQIWLTYTQGPQMIGFTMAHQFLPLLLLGFLGEIGCAIWCIAALVIFVRRRHEIGTFPKVQFALAAVTLLLQWVPVDEIVLKLR